MTLSPEIEHPYDASGLARKSLVPSTEAMRVVTPEIAHFVSTMDSSDVDDATFYRGLPNGSELRVLGLDASAPAVDYTLRTGLMQRGWASTHSRTDDFAPVAESHPPKAAR